MDETLVFEGIAEPDGLEDAGTALILGVTHEADENNHDGEWVKLHSNYGDVTHPRLMQLMGRRVRVTVEVLETAEEMLARESTKQMLAREAIEAKAATYRDEMRAVAEQEAIRQNSAEAPADEDQRLRRVAALVFATVEAPDDRTAEWVARTGVHKALVQAGEPGNPRVIRFPDRRGGQLEIKIAAIEPLSWMMNPDLCRITPSDGPFICPEEK